VEAVGGRGLVIAGVHGVGWHQARHWAELAAEDGADGVLLLPPTLYRANRQEVLTHYAKVNEVGLPIMMYNNPIDTKVDLTPDLIAELFELPNVVAVKEFSLDARRVREIRDACAIDVIAGADDLLFEALIAGATGWFAGYPNAFPREAVELYELLTADRVAEARTLFEQMAPVFSWDSKTEFVQAIKYSIDVAGESFGGPTRPPRGPLSAAQQELVRRDTERALQYSRSRAAVG
jgi:4-hydroxy-tetrahydrodipicolinate synthase